MKKLAAILMITMCVGFAQAITYVIDFEGNNGFTSYGQILTTYQPIPGVVVGYSNVGTYGGSGTWNTWQFAGAGKGPQVFTFSKAVAVNSVDLCQYDTSATTITAKAYSDTAGYYLLGSHAIAIPTRSGGGGTGYVWQAFTGFAQYGPAVKRITFDAAGGSNPNAQVDNIKIGYDEAYNPAPTNGAVVPTTTAELSWVNPDNVGKCDVWFGAGDANSLNYKSRLTRYTITTPTQAPARQTFAVPEPLADSKYSWVVNCYRGTPLPTEPNLPGSVWQFTATAAPLINTNPANQIKDDGQTAVFTVTFNSISPVSTGWPKWYKEAGDVDTEMFHGGNVTIVTTGPVGITYTTTLSIANVAAGNEGQYYCEVKNAGGVIPSASAKLYLKKLVAYWKFENNLNDETGAYNGTGDPNFIAHDVYPTQLGQTLLFDGTSDFVDLPDGFSDFTSGMTITVWAKPTAVNNWARFVDIGNSKMSGTDPVGDEAILFARVGASATLRLDTFHGNIEAANAIALNEWQMFAVTVTDAGDAILYKNGLPIKTGTVGLPAVVVRTSNFIGKSNWSNWDALYKGQMDDARIYNYARTADEIATQYAQAAGNFCRTKPAYDFSSDCKVSMSDFAIFAQGWLSCGLYPVCP